MLCVLLYYSACYVRVSMLKPHRAGCIGMTASLVMLVGGGRLFYDNFP